MKHRFNSKVEFYITNVCNLSCSNCNRFNNHRFKGFQRWSDYADTYQRWAQHIELQSIVLLGGEPLLNPTVVEWVQGLKSIFNCDVQILTNGLQLNRVPGLYEAAAQHAKNLKSFIHFQISIHNLNHFEYLREQAKLFLREPFKEWGQCLERTAPQHHRDYQAYYTIQDVNDVQINMHVDNNFYTAAIQQDVDGQFVVHDSDPEQAHAQCGFVKFRSYHFINGALHKCGPAPLFAEFDQQLGLKLTEEQRQIMLSYEPYTIERIEQHGVEILQNIDQPIPQCRFCPTQFDNTTIWPEKKSGTTINILPWPNNKIP